MIRAAEITAKLLLGKEVSTEDREYLKNYNYKYEEVRRKYLAYKNADKDTAKDPILVNFHFSPTDTFMEASVEEILEELIKFQEAALSGATHSKRLEGFSWRESNPPRTNKEKKPLR